MQVVYVDGMGGRRAFCGALFKFLSARGHSGHYFGYRPGRELLAQIEARLLALLTTVAACGPFVLVGYSFGGVLSRRVLPALPAASQPQQLILLGSPGRAHPQCQRFDGWGLYRRWLGECGQLVASEAGMAALPHPTVPTLCLYGHRPIAGFLNLAGASPSDGLVPVGVVQPERFNDTLALPVSHPALPTHRLVLEALAARLGEASR